MAGLGFAKKQLEKHGWEEGKGLGKEETGITKAIKVGVKNDTRGVGYDLGEQFTFHWWDHVFNKTAKSIVIEESEDGVQVTKDSNSNHPISNKRPSKNLQKPLFYGRFVRASSSASETKAEQSDSDSEEDKDFSNQHPEDKVFQACGGRTAHKAARHGLKLNGKLRRIEEHEKVALSEPCSRSGSPDISQEKIINEGELQVKLKRRKKHLKCVRVSYSDSEEYVKKKRKRKHFNDESSNVEIAPIEVPEKKKKTKRKKGGIELKAVDETGETCKQEKVKKRKKKEECDAFDDEEVEDGSAVEMDKTEKRKKKSRKKGGEKNSSNNIIELCFVETGHKVKSNKLKSKIRCAEEENSDSLETKEEHLHSEFKFKDNNENPEKRKKKKKKKKKKKQ